MEEEKLHLFGEFVLDTGRGSLLRDGRPIHLRPQAYNTLKYLAENRGRLISKDRLIEVVWEGRAVTDDSLVQCLRDVRQALGDEGNRYLRNERGRGYIFDSPPEGQAHIENNRVWTEQVEMVRVVVEDEEEPSRSDALPESEAPVLLAERPAVSTNNFLSRITRHKGAAAMSLAAIALTAAGIVYFTRFATRGQEIRTIAVLPFANDSGDPNLEYLSDGLSESLIDRLSQLPGLKVIARSSSFKYKGQDNDPLEVAKALDVEALLMGRIVQRGDDLQVRAELVEAHTGTQIWGEQYVRKASDIQAVQEDIARTVTSRLRLQLTGAQEQRLIKHATEDTQAYQFYLNGLFHFRQIGVENGKRALNYFQQAVAIDPDFALAWAGVAKVHNLFAGNSWLDPKEANAKAKAAAQTALRLDEALPEAHLALALIKQHEWDWAGAEREFKRALELNPSLVDAHTQYASYLSLMERHDEALAEIKRAQELDPLTIQLKRREAFLLNIARRYDEALELMQEGIKAELPRVVTPRGLAFIYEMKGMHEEAIAQHQKVNSIEGETTGGLCYLGYALAAAGRKKEVGVILNKLNTTREYVSPTELAALYAMLGDNERAFALLEKAYAAHDLQLQYLKIEPHFDSVRSDPRFQDLLMRVGLPKS